MAADKTSIKGLVYASLFGALTAAGAFIVIPLPPVPITAQTFFLNISAILLGGQLGARVYALTARATVRYEREDFFKKTKFQYERIKPGLVATPTPSPETPVGIVRMFGSVISGSSRT